VRSASAFDTALGECARKSALGWRLPTPRDDSGEPVATQLDLGIEYTPPD
jgi:hypothetical protein